MFYNPRKFIHSLAKGMCFIHFNFKDWRPSLAPVVVFLSPSSSSSSFCYLLYARFSFLLYADPICRNKTRKLFTIYFVRISAAIQFHSFARLENFVVHNIYYSFWFCLYRQSIFRVIFPLVFWALRVFFFFIRWTYLNFRLSELHWKIQPTPIATEGFSRKLNI